MKPFRTRVPKHAGTTDTYSAPNLIMLWDIFCKVVDNHGDLGVSWRLSADLASRGEQVRLWVDEPAALEWMAPEGRVGVQLIPWTQPVTMAATSPCDVLVETFGCEVSTGFLNARARSAPPPVWINLEYLSAEAYADRSHGLSSPVMHGPAAGWAKWFFYPGFTPRTGGLLREADLASRQSQWQRDAWRQRLWRSLEPEPDARVGSVRSADERWISLFCYEPAALDALLTQLQHAPQRSRLLVTPGRAAAAVKAALERRPPEPEHRGGATDVFSISYLPHLSQPDFDELLWGCDLNFVRGEDSLVRALWAGQPFVWQIYPNKTAPTRRSSRRCWTCSKRRTPCGGFIAAGTLPRQVLHLCQTFGWTSLHGKPVQAARARAGWHRPT